MNTEAIKYIIIIVFIITLIFWSMTTIGFMATYKDCMADMVDFFDIDKYCPVFCSDRVGYSDETGATKWINFTVPNITDDIQEAMICRNTKAFTSIEEYINCSKHVRPA